MPFINSDGLIYPNGLILQKTGHFAPEKQIFSPLSAARVDWTVDNEPKCLK